MRSTRLFAALTALMLSTQGFASTFVCGSVACNAFGTQAITGIDDLVVDGSHFDVSFSNTPATGSSFLFSNSASGSGQPITGVDAANALDAFYATQGGSLPGQDGPGILASVGGTDVAIFSFVTAFQASGTPGVVDIDVITPFLGFSGGPVQQAPDVGDNLPAAGGAVAVSHVADGALCGSFATCTVWTPVAAPEISLSSAPAALTLLLGAFMVLRGRRLV